MDVDHAAAVLPAIEFHTCMMSASVTMDSWVQNALRESCQIDDEKTTVFNIWMYFQLLNTGIIVFNVKTCLHECFSNTRAKAS